MSFIVAKQKKLEEIGFYYSNTAKNFFLPNFNECHCIIKKFDFSFFSNEIFHEETSTQIMRF